MVDAYQAITESFNYTLKKLGYPARGQAVIRRAVGRGDENLLKPFVKDRDLPKALSLYRRHHRGALLIGSCLFPRVKIVLNYLKSRGCALAIASNRPSAFSRILIDHLKISRYFDYVLCADKLKHGKPHPEILDKIRKKFSLGRQDVVYVGDMSLDAQAGRRAGIKTVIVTTGSSAKSEIRKEKPYRIIGKIADFLRVFPLPGRRFYANLKIHI